MSKKFEVVLFDLDGTLLDTLQDLADSGNTALCKLRFPVHPMEDYKYFVGEGMENLVSKTLPKDKRDAATVRKCAELAVADYRQRWMRNSKPYPGIPELLSALDKRGLAKVVLSNKPDEFTRIMTEKLLSRWQFDIVRGQMPGVPTKPNPTAALQIAEELKMSPDKFLYLGDSNIDMQTANAAGMYAIGVLWGFRTAEELLSSGATVLVKEPQEVLKLIVP